MKAQTLLGFAALLAACGNVGCGSSDASAPPGEGPSGVGGAGTGIGGYMPVGAPGGGAQAFGGAGTTVGGNGAVIPNGGSGNGTSNPGGGGAGNPGGGAGNTGGTTATGNYTVDPVGNKNRAPGFVDLSPPMGAALDDAGTPLTPAAPTGWTWYQIDGAVCRDGTPTGFFVHKGTLDKLAIYLEGGGACSNDHFCAFNPASANQILAGDGSNVLGSTAGAGPGRQQPGGYTDSTHTAAPAGLFDFANAANPFKDFSQVYVPYCTGDVHYGMKKNGTVPNLAAPQQFVGGINMRLFIGRIVPTFKGKVSQVVLTGPSAGGFGAALNYSMVQDSFGDTPVVALDDSGPPFDDKYMPVCMQKKWREGWGFQFPPDCKECQQADGGGMVHLSDFLMKKHPKGKIGIISSMQDEVIRLFYSVGLKDCSGYDAADPVAITLGQLDATVYFLAQQYTDGLNDLRTKYVASGQLSTYFMSGQIHQHIFRPEFFTATAGSETEAAWVGKLLAGQMEQVGP
jgi:hypothetical protein